MVEYSKLNVKLSKSQLNKLKNSAKYQTEATLRMNIILYVFENNMPADVKLSKVQIPKIIQSGE